MVTQSTYKHNLDRVQTWDNGRYVQAGYWAPSLFIYLDNIARILTNDLDDVLEDQEAKDGITLPKLNNKYFDALSILQSEPEVLEDLNPQTIYLFGNYTWGVQGNERKDRLRLSLLAAPGGANNDEAFKFGTVYAQAFGTFLYIFNPQELVLNWPYNIAAGLQTDYQPTVVRIPNFDVNPSGQATARLGGIIRVDCTFEVTPKKRKLP